MPWGKTRTHPSVQISLQQPTLHCCTQILTLGLNQYPVWAKNQLKEGKVNILATDKHIPHRQYFGDTKHTDAWFHMLETSFGQIPEQSKRTLAHFWHFVLSSWWKQPTVSNISVLVTVSKKTLGVLFTCMHWYRRVRMLLRATSCSMVPPKPSASPLKRSKATIMKSLSGASCWSGWD